MRTIFRIRSLLLALFLLAAAGASFGQVSIGISVGFAPPPIPVYVQPICPHEGYIWTPGYWAWDPEDEDYYWVPGTWVEAPEVGYLWTPGWWGWERGAFFFHEGYWGPRVGWYGGINYGFGYFGHGYDGGRWDHDRFYYNRSVTNVNITEIHNVYNTTVINRNETRVSYNGGDGGIRERPTREEESYSRERHIAPVAVQNQHIQEARGNRELRASVNQGRPPIAATQRPTSFRGSTVVPAKEAGGRWEPPANRRVNNNAGHPGNNNNPNRPPNAGGNSNRPPFNHASEITPHDRPAPPNTGNPKLDQKYRQQQEKLYAKQEQEHQKLQQRQEQDHQHLAQQNANEARRQQTEQRHQQQTQQMEQRHAQQQQRMQERQQPQHQSGGGGKPGRP
jgi:WXXGXW repeat (2 copies)